MATAPRVFVDTDILIDIARKHARAIDFWQRAEARSAMTCSVVSVFELLAVCRNLREQRATLKSFASMEIVQIENGGSSKAVEWYRAYHVSRGIGFLDCLIAAAAQRVEREIHTLNTKHFKAVPGLRVAVPY